PEQMHSRPNLDGRADIWALGAVAYEVLGGERAFEGQSVTEVCAKVLTETPRPLRALRADGGPELEVIVSRCLEREPGERFQDILELTQALEQARMAHSMMSERPPSPR